jgi:hypothetical protein
MVVYKAGEVQSTPPSGVAVTWSQSYDYNASTVKNYNAMSSLVRFESKNIFSTFKNALSYLLVVNLTVVGLAP